MISLHSESVTPFGAVMSFFHGGHEGGNLHVGRHAAHAVVAARHDAEKLAVRAAVVRDRHGGMARLLLELKDILEGLIRLDVGIAHNKARLVGLRTGDHRRLSLHALRAVDERNAALLGERNGHFVVGNGLHDSRHHRNVHRDGRLLALAELCQRSLQAHIRRDTLRRGVTRDQQVFVEGMTGFVVKISHSDTSSIFFFLSPVFRSNP